MHCDFPRTTGGGRSPDFKTMRACVLHDVRALAVRNVPTPQLGPRDVLLRVAAVGLCGTDLHIYQGEPTTTWTREDSLCLSLVTRRFSATRSQGRSLQWAQRSVICAKATSLRSIRA